MFGAKAKSAVLTGGLAFGEAAAVCLDVYGEPKTATSKLCSLVAYYPTSIPDPRHRFTASFRVLVHLAQGSGDNEETVGIVRRPEVLGIQARRKTVTKRVTPGIGTGGLLAKMEYPAFTYEGVDPGFAEHDLEQYDAVADAIAWSRSLNVVRRGFGAEVNLERPWEDNMERKKHLISQSVAWSTTTNSQQRNTVVRTSKSSWKRTSTIPRPASTSHRP